MFIAGVNDTGEKLFSGVNDTTDKFFGGVNDTGEYRVLPILACLKLLPVSTTPPKNCSPVSTTPPINDTGKYRVLPILACQHLKMKNKEKFNL